MVNQFILQQDADEGSKVMPGEEEEMMQSEADDYVDDGGMAKVKVRRKKISPLRKKPNDYESPYAEYLLNAIKDNPTTEYKVISI
jgi:hypothetical protein